MKHKNYGFTLIELIVAMGIMAILTTIVLANYKKADQTRRAQLASDTVLSALRDGQNSALSGKAGTGCGNSNPYVVRFTYSSKTISMGCTINSIQTYQIPDKTVISTMKVTDLSNNLTTDNSKGLLVYFYPPFGLVQVCPATDALVLNCTSSPTKFSKTTITVQSTTGTPVSYTITLDGISGKIDASQHPN